MQSPSAGRTVEETDQPVTSAMDAIDRLKGLAWEFPLGPMRKVKYYSTLIILLVVMTIWIVYLMIPLLEDLIIYLPLLTILVTFHIIMALALYISWRFHQSTRDHMMRRLPVAIPATLHADVERALADCGIAYTRTTVVTAPRLLDRLLSAFHQHDTMYKLPAMGASVVLGEDFREREVPISVVFLGPLTDKNASDLVRLAETMERIYRLEEMEFA